MRAQGDRSAPKALGGFEVSITQPREGVWVSPHGKLKVFYVENGKWFLDEGRTVSHKLFRLRTYVVSEMSIGWPIWAYGLKGHEWLSEL